MEKISDIILKQLEEMLIGKRVKTKGVSGICSFIGYNECLPRWDLQITIGRMPISNVIVKDIILL